MTMAVAMTARQLDRWPQAVPVAGGLQGCVQVLVVDRPEGTGIVPLPVEALHDADSRHVLLDAGVHAGDGHPCPAYVRLGKPAPEHEAWDEQGDHAEHDRRKQGVHQDHRYGNAHDADQVGQGECEDGEQCLAQLHHVVLDPRHDPARLVAVVEGHRQGLDVLEEPGADVEDQALAEPHQETAVDHAHGESQQGHQAEQPDGCGKAGKAAVVRHDLSVDRPLDRPGQRHHRAAVHQHGREGQGYLAPVRAGVLQQPEKRLPVANTALVVQVETPGAARLPSLCSHQ